jgi:hypothetical protein
MLYLAYTRPGDGELRQRAVIGVAWVRNRVIERCCRP